MTAMFGHMWHSEQGPRINPQTQRYTTNFLLWCEKTDPLTDEEFALGLKLCEWEKIEHERLAQGNELWPPSYPGFIGKCRISRDRIPAGVMSAREKQRLERLEKPLMTEEEKQRDRAIGARNIASLKNLLSEGGGNETETNQVESRDS